jgi:hypothetical protein
MLLAVLAVLACWHAMHGSAVLQLLLLLDMQHCRAVAVHHELIWA